jgi:hypothetical protein
LSGRAIEAFDGLLLALPGFLNAILGLPGRAIERFEDLLLASLEFLNAIRGFRWSAWLTSSGWCSLSAANPCFGFGRLQ